MPWILCLKSRSSTSPVVVDPGFSKGLEHSSKLLPSGQQVSLPRGILRGLAESVDGTLQTFAEAACENIGDINTVVPPAPPLTRFKAGLAEKEDEKQKKKLKTKITEPEVQQLWYEKERKTLFLLLLGGGGETNSK